MRMNDYLVPYIVCWIYGQTWKFKAFLLHHFAHSIQQQVNAQSQSLTINLTTNQPMYWHSMVLKVAHIIWYFSHLAAAPHRSAIQWFGHLGINYNEALLWICNSTLSLIRVHSILHSPQTFFGSVNSVKIFLIKKFIQPIFFIHWSLGVVGCT